MPDELNGLGEAWTIPQLRRKSFEDLHTLWYVCIKERNTMLREVRVVQHALGRRQVEESTSRIPTYQEALDKIKTTMWRIRHVLAERHHSHINGMNAFWESYEEILSEFEAEYLAASDAEDASMESMLERFQYAYFGINPMLEENFPGPNVVRGLKVVADLKLKRFAPAAGADDINKTKDVREAFVVFMAEHTPDGIADAVASIRQYRQTNPAEVRPHEEVQVLAQLMFNLEKEKNRNDNGSSGEAEPSAV
jgi:large subunit ribosomal protein L47